MPSTIYYNMKEKADTWQMELANIAWEFEETIKTSDLAALNLKKDPQTWSIAEIIAHLIKVNASYFPTFDQIIKNEYKPPLIGRIPGLGKKIGDMILKAMDSPKKTKTFDLWYPASQPYGQSLFDNFYDQHHLLSSYVQNLDPFLERDLVISSPANKWVVYRLDQAIEIIIQHEKRHLKQIKILMEQTVS